MEQDWRSDLFSTKDRQTHALDTGFLSDCCFAVAFDSGEDKNKENKSEIFNAHKIILALASPVFEKMFFGALAEKTDKKIEISDVEPKTFARMLKYIYSDSIEFDTWEDAALLFGAAKKYMLDALAKFCIEFIKKELEIPYILEILKFAKFHEENDLIDAALKIIREKTLLVFDTTDFDRIDISTMTIILEQHKLQATEMELFDALEALYQRVFANFSETKNEENYGNIDIYNNKLFEKFRMAVKKINFLSMTAEQFSSGPAFSKLLLPEEASAISACLNKRSNIKSHYPKDFVQNEHRSKILPWIFFDITVNGLYIGRIITELRSDVVPKTVKNFRKVCTGEKPNSFKGFNFDDVNDESLYFKSITNEFIETENFVLKHKPGVFSLISEKDNNKKMAKDGFFITFKQCKNLDGRNVVFGQVVQGMDVLETIQSLGTDSEDLPKYFQIENCGEIPTFYNTLV